MGTAMAGHCQRSSSARVGKGEYRTPSILPLLYNALLSLSGIAIRYESRSTGRNFFRNRLTGEVQWTLPESKGVHAEIATTPGVVTSLPVARNIVSAYMDSSPSPGEQDVPLQPRSRRAMLREQQEMTKKLKQQLRAATSGAAEEPGYIGLEITKTPPHAVVAVNDIVDENRVRQDCPGYGNPRVRPGDRLLAIDSAKCERVSVQCIHNLLRGAAGSIVELTLARSQGGSVYNVRALRHGIHEFSKHAPRPPPVAASPHDAVSAVPSDVALDGRSQLWRSRPTLQGVDDRAPEISARAKAATRDLVTDHEPRRFSSCIADEDGRDIVVSEASRGDDAPELGETVASTGVVLEDRDVEKMKREMGEGDRRMSRLEEQLGLIQKQLIEEKTKAGRHEEGRQQRSASSSRRASIADESTSDTTEIAGLPAAWSRSSEEQAQPATDQAHAHDAIVPASSPTSESPPAPDLSHINHSPERDETARQENAGAEQGQQAHHTCADSATPAEVVMAAPERGMTNRPHEIDAQALAGDAEEAPDASVRAPDQSWLTSARADPLQSCCKSRSHDDEGGRQGSASCRAQSGDDSAPGTTKLTESPAGCAAPAWKLKSLLPVHKQTPSRLSLPEAAAVSDYQDPHLPHEEGDAVAGQATDALPPLSLSARRKRDSNAAEEVAGRAAVADAHAAPSGGVDVPASHASDDEKGSVSSMQDRVARPGSSHALCRSTAQESDAQVTSSAPAACAPAFEKKASEDGLAGMSGGFAVGGVDELQAPSFDLRELPGASLPVSIPAMLPSFGFLEGWGREQGQQAHLLRADSAAPAQALIGVQNRSDQSDALALAGDADVHGATDHPGSQLRGPAPFAAAIEHRLNTKEEAAESSVTDSTARIRGGVACGQLRHSTPPARGRKFAEDSGAPDKPCRTASISSAGADIADRGVDVAKADAAAMSPAERAHKIVEETFAQAEAKARRRSWLPHVLEHAPDAVGTIMHPGITADQISSAQAERPSTPTAKRSVAHLEAAVAKSPAEWAHRMVEDKFADLDLSKYQTDAGDGRASTLATPNLDLFAIPGFDDPVLLDISDKFDLGNMAMPTWAGGGWESEVSYSINIRHTLSGALPGLLPSSAGGNMLAPVSAAIESTNLTANLEIARALCNSDDRSSAELLKESESGELAATNEDVVVSCGSGEAGHKEGGRKPSMSKGKRPGFPWISNHIFPENHTELLHALSHELDDIGGTWSAALHLPAPPDFSKISPSPGVGEEFFTNMLSLTSSVQTATPANETILPAAQKPEQRAAGESAAGGSEAAAALDQQGQRPRQGLVPDKAEEDGARVPSLASTIHHQSSPPPRAAGTEGLAKVRMDAPVDTNQIEVESQALEKGRSEPLASEKERQLRQQNLGAKKGDAEVVDVTAKSYDTTMSEPGDACARPVSLPRSKMKRRESKPALPSGKAAGACADVAGAEKMRTRLAKAVVVAADPEKAAFVAAQAFQDAGDRINASKENLIELLRQSSAFLLAPNVADGRPRYSEQHGERTAMGDDRNRSSAIAPEVSTTMDPAATRFDGDRKTREKAVASRKRAQGRSRSCTSSSCMRGSTRSSRSVEPRWDVSASELAGAARRTIPHVACNALRRKDVIMMCEVAQSQGHAARTALGASAEFAAAMAASEDTARRSPTPQGESGDDGARAQPEGLIPASSLAHIHGGDEALGGDCGVPHHQSTPPPRGAAPADASDCIKTMLPAATATPLSPRQLARLEHVWQSALTSDPSDDRPGESCTHKRLTSNSLPAADTPRLLRELGDDIRLRIARSRPSQESDPHEFSRADLAQFVSAWQPTSASKRLSGLATAARPRARLRVASLRAR